MSGPDPEPPDALDRVVRAISEGRPVEWEAELESRPEESEELAALRLIDQVARANRAAAAPPPDPPPDLVTWGGLEIRGRIAAGAYGEVFRAFDPGLRREVALKLWPATDQPNVIEQILEEARALARVNHPNVLAVYGADVHDGRAGMWTELVEGITLEQLLEHSGPCTWREAALYGIEICRALAAVHALGLVHRDIKAANVQRERGGRVVLMDFGSVAGSRPGATAGVQGTPLAMAPEVLRGEPATAASDVYSLGVLLYRQITARYPLQAESLETLRARIEAGPLPSLREARADAPLAFARAVDRALERDPLARLASASELERLLAESLAAEWGLEIAPPRGAKPPRKASAVRRALYWCAAVAAGALLGWGAWRLTAPAGGDWGRPMQFTLKLPPGEHLERYANLAVSPDGHAVAFASVDSLGRRALWVRRFDALGSVRIPGTEDAMYPFWSPDSRNVGFFTNTHLKRVGVEGDSVRVVCATELGRGATWNRSGTIVFAGSTQGPLQRVAAGGGTPIPATMLNEAEAEVSHRWPSFLPDGERFLYVRTPERDGTYSLYVGSLRSERRVYVGEVESGAVYASGLLVYLRNRSMEARPFDPRTLRWKGDPVAISDLPATGGSLAEPHASVSQDGTLVYTFVTAGVSRLEWVDLETGIARPLAVGAYFDPALSPDGRRIIAERSDGAGKSNLWMLDAETGVAARWTDALALNRKPVWSAAGDSVIYTSNRSGSYQLFARATNGAFEERAVLSPPRALLLWADEWRRDGSILFDRYEPVTGYNVYELRDGRVTPVAATEADEMRAARSPDGRWLAYDSNASGVTRVHVVERGSARRWELTPGGGMAPRWVAATGRLLYHTELGEVVEVTPVPGRPPTEWPARALFRTGRLSGFAVDPRGGRVLCCVRTPSDRPAEIGVLAHLPQAVAQGP